MSTRGSGRAAREGLQALGSVAGGLAHEIKNPLSTITINLGLLREDLEGERGDRAKALRRVKVLEREVMRLEEILADFLQYAGRLRLERRPTDLNALVAEVLDFVSPLALEKKIEVRHYLSGEVPSLRLDRDRVKQALLNLVLNAQEAMTGRADPADESRGGRDREVRAEPVKKGRTEAAGAGRRRA